MDLGGHGGGLHVENSPVLEIEFMPLTFVVRPFSLRVNSSLLSGASPAFIFSLGVLRLHCL